MAKRLKTKFPFLFRSTSAAAWPWPATCATNNPRTLSFRAESADPDPAVVVGGLRSDDRLFFEPGESKSILEAAKGRGAVAVVALESRDPVGDFRASMDEMVEADGGQGVWDWKRLEELLACYLRFNAADNYQYILAAFVDLLLSDGGAAASSSSSSSTYKELQNSFTSPLSFSSCSSIGHCCSISLPENEEGEINKPHSPLLSN